MKKSLFDRQHLMDYTFYGILSGIFYSISVWLYLYGREFREGWIMYVGSAFFAFVIMLYIVKLWQEKADLRKSIKNVYAGHIATLTGVVVSIILTILLCSIFKSELSSSVGGLMHPGRKSSQNFLIFLPGITVNFFAGSFISLLIGYAMKWNYSAKEKSVSL